MYKTYKCKTCGAIVEAIALDRHLRSTHSQWLSTSPSNEEIALFYTPIKGWKLTVTQHIKRKIICLVEGATEGDAVQAVIHEEFVHVMPAEGAADEVDRYEIEWIEAIPESNLIL